MERLRKIKFFTVERLSFQMLGIDLLATEDREIFKVPMLFFFQLTCAVLTVLSLLGYAIKNRNDVNKIAEAYSIVMANFITILKILIFMPRRQRCVHLIRSLQDLAKKANAQEHLEWLGENQRTTLITSCFGITLYLSGFICMLTPFFQLANDYVNNSENLTLGVPFEGIYPYDHTRPLGFLFTYIVSGIGLFMLVNAAAGIDCIFCWYIFNISAHFRILGVKLKHLAGQVGHRELDFARFTNLLGSVVSYHLNVIDFVTEINAVFGEIIFVEVSLNCILLCFNLYLLSGDVDSRFMAISVVLFTSVTAQLSIYCFCGEKLQNESETICTNMYLLFPWDRMTPAMKRSLLLPLMRSQQVAVMQAYWLVLNRNLLVTIFKSGASFSALLRTMEEE